MPLMKGHSKQVVSKNISEMIKAGHKPKQAIAASLANARKYRKMAEGGMAEDAGYESDYEDDESQATKMAYGGMATYANGGAVEEDQDVEHGGMEDIDPYVREDRYKGGKDESMDEMGRKGPEDQKRSLNEIREDGEYYPDEVANPEEQKEARGFAAALRRQAKMVMNPENYAEGGLVQDGPEEDQRMHGTSPELDWIDDGTAEPMSSMPMKPDGLEYKPKEREPSGPGLSREAMEALREKKKNRRYGSYDPSKM